MKFLNGLTVLVLGLGESGLAMARWSARCGATVRAWDSREAPPHAAAFAESLPGAVLLTGALTDAAVEGVQLILKSPGLAPGDARIQGPVAQAADRGILVLGELELFSRALADLKADRGYAPKVIAVTGTNGKTTTVSMAARFIERAGRRVALAGNIGPTMLQTLSDALDLEPAATVHPEPVEGPSALQPVETEGFDKLSPDGVERLALASTRRSLAFTPELVEGSARTEVGIEAVETAATSDADTSAGAKTDTHVDTHTDTHTDANANADTDTDTAEPTSSVHPEPVEGPAAAEGSSTESEASVLTESASPADDTPISPDGQLPPGLVPPPPPGPVFEHLPEVWVLELSSFQLDEAKGFEPSAAAVLNITQDHLDWHGTMAAYTQAKARIFGKDAVMVVNRDDPAVEALVPRPPEAAGGKKAKAPKFVPRQVVRFGLDAPAHPGDYGLVTENGMAWLVRAMEADETVKKPRRGAAAQEEDLIIQRLMPADALRLRGRHNAANALAALALATAIGCPLAPMLHGLREYGGEPHRVEYVATIDGVDAFDDSKGTNVGATVAAVLGLGLDRAPAKLVAILGGDGKGQDFGPLVEPVQRHARAVATIGRDAPAVEAALQVSGVTVQRHETLEAATRWAFDVAQPGDAVLLSPACASLDMFRNYAHRAEVFVAAVEEIAQERGLA